MPTISVRDNENNRLKRNATTKNKDRKEQGGQKLWWMGES